MAIDTNKNTRLALTMNRELHSIVKEYANKENRKVSNFIINCVVEYLRNKYKDEL